MKIRSFSTSSEESHRSDHDVANLRTFAKAGARRGGKKVTSQSDVRGVSVRGVKDVRDVDSVWSATAQTYLQEMQQVRLIGIRFRAR